MGGKGERSDERVLFWLIDVFFFFRPLLWKKLWRKQNQRLKKLLEKL